MEAMRVVLLEDAIQDVDDLGRWHSEALGEGLGPEVLKRSRKMAVRHDDGIVDGLDRIAVDSGGVGSEVLGADELGQDAIEL